MSSADEKARSLSLADATDLAQYVAELAKAGVPLDSGLASLADELPNRRVARSLRALAGQLAAGVPLDAAVKAPGVRLPPYFQALLAAGLRGGNLAAVFERFLQHQRLLVELRRKLWLALAYPLAMLAFVAAWTWYVGALAKSLRYAAYTQGEQVWVAPENVWVAPAIVLAAIAGLLVGPRLLTLTAGGSRILAAVPLLGPLTRNMAVAEFASLLAALIEQGTPLPAALELTAAGLCNRGLGQAARNAAARVERGQSLGQALAVQPMFPALGAAIVEESERAGRLAQGLELVAEHYRADVRPHASLAVVVGSVVAFVAIYGLFTATYSSIFGPLLREIQIFSK